MPPDQTDAFTPLSKTRPASLYNERTKRNGTQYTITYSGDTGLPDLHGRYDVDDEQKHGQSPHANEV